MNNLKESIKNRVYQFFVESFDFNGIPLRNISEELTIEYEESINLIKELVTEGFISIQSSTNPHIIGFKHHPTQDQLEFLEQAKNTKIEIHNIGDITLKSESTEYPICLYPSINELIKKRNLSDFGHAVYTKKLALGSPQLLPVFFEIEVLERYVKDPRFEFKFSGYSGRIYSKYDENNNPIVREEDELFLKTFGLGFDEKGNRLAVVYLRHLKGLTSEHQVYWKGKEVQEGGKVIEEYHDNNIRGRWTFSYSIFSAFIGELNCLNELSLVVFNKQIFRQSFDADNCPKEFSFFFTPTLKNFNEFVLLLDKMLSDNINRDFFKDKVELYDLQEIKGGLVERKPKGTLRLFEEWLTLNYNVDDESSIEEVFKPLKNVRKLRQNPAHRINEDEYDKKYDDMQRNLIRKAYSSIRTLRKAFQQHRKAKHVEIPDWLDNGNIKIF
jgi:hypothetical protein